MNESTAITLMESIAAHRLSILCGAGLSMAAPSRVPSAARVAEVCAERYQRNVGASIPAPQSGDLEQMALWLRDRGRFDPLFLDTLVPWENFNTVPNSGHEAVADLLGCRIAREATTTNFDSLIERAAASLGEPDFRAIVEVADLPASREHSPLLKVHGCGERNRRATIWCRQQLEDASLTERSARFRAWLETNLLGRDILIVGFWSDWLYLMEVFASTLPALGQCTVVLVAPDSAEDLQRKAPALWAWAHSSNVNFIHERESGATLLDELRCRWSRTFLDDLMHRAEPTYEEFFGESPQDATGFLHSLSAVELYALRRDLTGTPRHRVVRDKSHQTRFTLHSAFHRRLLDSGATYSVHTYQIEGEAIRLVSGHGELLSAVRARFADEPVLPIPHYRVVCVGATADPSPFNIVRPDEQPSILSAGTPLEWSTHDELGRRLRRGADD